MYKVYCDNTLIHDGSSPSEEIHVEEPVLKLSDSAAGSFEMSIPTKSLGYSLCEKMTSTIFVKEESDIIWSGRIISENKDMWNRRKLICEGALSFLNDSTQDLAYYGSVSVSQFITTLLNIHNAKVADNRKIFPGVITVQDDEEHSYETNYKSTYEEMKDNFLDRLNGHLRVRYRNTDGVAFLDYLSDYPNTSTQEINFGENLLEFAQNWDMSSLCTVILPKGKQLDEETSHDQKQYVTIASVNSGSKYLVNTSAYNTYGRIERIVEFSDCETPQLLLELGTAYLSAMQFDNMSIDIRAVDLHFLNPNISRFNLLDNVHCISYPHGMDRYFPISEIDMPLDQPWNVKYTLGGTATSMTGANASSISAITNAVSGISSTETILNKTNQQIVSALTPYARIDHLEANYAHISDGVIDNAKIYFADVEELDAHYAHINNGIIDNAYIDAARVRDLDTDYAHITNGVIDNATIGYADVNGLEANYAKIKNGVITNATIDQANVNDLENNYAHIRNGVIDNARISYAKVNDLDTHYALIDISNVNNAWIENGVVRNASITDAMILSMSANKISAGTIDAGVITVINLNAGNITAGTLNGQRIGTGSLSLDKLSEDVYTQDEIDDMVDTLNNRINSAIETYTGNVIPTLNNSPASSWNTTALKDSHIGDIYYVVNPSLSENGYAYRFSSINGTYSWELIRDTNVTDTLQRLQTAEDKIVVIERFDTDIASWKTNTDNTLSSMQAAHTTLEATVGASIIETVQLWYTKENTSAPSKPGIHVTSTSLDPNQWTTVVPEYNKNNSNYFYCYEYKYANGTYGWSNVVLDRAMTEAQTNSQSGIISSVQLWTTDATENIPLSPTGVRTPADLENIEIDYLLDSNSLDIVDLNDRAYYANQTSAIDDLQRGLLVEYIIDSFDNRVVDNYSDPYNVTMRWTIEVPEYESARPNYFYCWEYHHVDGTISWSDAVLDRAMTDVQRKSANNTEAITHKVETTTFNEVKQTVDGNSAKITQLTTVVDDNNATISNTVNTISQTVNTNSSKISNLTQRLGTNADGTGSSEDIVSKHTELVQDLDGFKSTVNQTYATKTEVDNIQIGGRNLLKLTKEFVGTNLIDEEGNSLFDSSSNVIATSKYASGFLNESESRLTFDRKDNLAVRYLSLSGVSGSVYSTFARFDDVITPETGHSYILSFYVKGGSKIDVYLLPSQGGETLTSVTSQGVTGSDSSGHVSINTNNVWSRVWVKWTFGGTTSNVPRDVELRLYGGNSAYVAGMKFEESDKATAWSPAPEDNDIYTEDYTQESIRALVERVSQAETQIVQNSESIGLKANSVTTYTSEQVDGLIEKEIVDRSAAIEIASEAITSSVSATYVTNTTFGALSSRVSTAESQIQQTEEGLELKADKTDVYTTTQIDSFRQTEVTNRNAAITAGINGFSTTVARTYTTKEEFNGLSIGGRNLLMLTAEFDDTYISDSNGASILDNSGNNYGEETDRYLTTGGAQLTNDYYNGLRIRYMSCSSLATSAYKEFARYKNVVIPDSGQSYVLSFYARGTGKINAYFYPNHTGGTCTAVTSLDTTNSNTDGNTEIALTNVWTRYWIRWTIGGSSNTSAYRNVLMRLFGGNTAYIAGMKFEEGTVATSWTPAVEDDGTKFDEKYRDLQSSIMSARAEFNVTADNINSVVSKKTDSGSIISTINQSAESILISAEKVDIAGAVIFHEYAKTEDLPTKVSELQNDILYQTASQVNSSISSGISGKADKSELPTKVSQLQNDSSYQTASQVSTSITNGISGKADKADAVMEEQYIYISKASGTTTTSGTTTWVTNNSGSQNTWTLKRPQYNSSYPVVFIAKQRKTVSGTVTCTTPVKDETTTIIDGGSIITGTIDASKAAITNINASNISSGTLSADRIAAGSLAVGKLDSATQTNISNGNTAATKLNNFGNDNLILNGAFRLDKNYWADWGSPTTREIVTIDGKKWMHCVTTTAQYQGYSQNHYSSGIIVEASTKYTIGIIARGSTNGVKVCVGIHWFNASSSSIISQSWNNFNTTTTATRYYWVVTVPSGINHFNIMVGDSQSTAQEFWVTDITFIKGEIQQPWYESSILANKSYESAREASKTSTDYITKIDNNGIKVHASSNTTTNYTQINADGMEVYKGGISVAKFSDTTRIGKSANAHIQMDYHSIKMNDRNNSEYISFEDLADSSGVATASAWFIVSSAGYTSRYSAQQKAFVINHPSANSTYFQSIVSVATRDSSDSSFVTTSAYTRSTTSSGTTITLNSALAYSAEVVVKYKTTMPGCYAYTLGTRITTYGCGVSSTAIGISNEAVGHFSMSSGTNSAALGYASHAFGNAATAYGSSSVAEGYLTHAMGPNSHAEGNSCIAGGNASHASGYGCIADQDYMTAVGLYNRSDVANVKFAVGNGNYSNPRNAFTVIGASNDTASAYFNGTSSSNGTTITSDERIKTLIKDLDPKEAIEFLRAVTPRLYYKEESNPEGDLGFYAQEVEKTVYGKQLVTKDNSGMYDLPDFRVLNYEGFLAPIVSTIQNLLDRVENLEAENKILKEQNQKLEERLERLEKLLFKED